MRVTTAAAMGGGAVSGKPEVASRKPVPPRDARNRPGLVCPIGHFLNPSPQRVVG